MKKVRLAIVGCGTIVERMHLPAIKTLPEVELTVLVDRQLDRAEQLGNRYDVPVRVDDFQQVLGKADAAIIALPNRLHKSVATQLLTAGIHVLVEKPMALNVAECDEMVQAARTSDALLAVGHEFRFFAASQMVKKLLESDLLGRVLSFDLRQGMVFSWPTASDYLFRKDAAGGGVLIDVGVHELDLLLWWLGDYDQVEYFDDDMGGVEANCELHLRLASGAKGIVELSRTRNLRNTCIIQGERGALEVTIWGYEPHLVFRTKNPNERFEWNPEDGTLITGELMMLDAFRQQTRNFLGAIREGGKPLVNGAEGHRVIKLVEGCYRCKKPLRQPWSQPVLSAG